jgi:hypothetical protein
MNDMSSQNRPSTNPAAAAGSSTSSTANTSIRAADSAALRSGLLRQHHDSQAASYQHDEPHHPAVESWVEVSSHPSSSSVSSIGEEIVTTGLRVGNSFPPRRRRLHPQAYSQPGARHQPTIVTSQVGQAGASSQEEYDESESEEDRLLTSSTENMSSPRRSGQTPLRQMLQVQPADSDSSDEDDDDDHATALGRRPSEPFRPQPNAFSHPPSHLTHRHSTSSSIPHHQHTRPSFSQRSSTRIDRRTPNFMSPSYQEDNDAALRASLTTLLSCAAAARGRPKDDEKEKGQRAGPAGGSQPVELRLMPESELMAPATSSPPAATANTQMAATRSSRAAPPAGPTRQATGEKIKRAATPPGTKSPCAAKKKKTGEETLISPTLLTWVVSAGVVVLVSVVGFGAGYVIGREVGRQETLSSLGGAGNASAIAEGSSCGREVMRSSGGTLRRFRWGSGMRSVAA